MYKQRDNEYHPPMTSDPAGSGVVSAAITVLQNGSGTGGSGGDEMPFGGPAVAAGSRKRGRDVRGLQQFRNVIYGENGFRRLHAMVARNPTLMYRPDGVDEARDRVAERAQREAEEQQQKQQQQSSHRQGAAAAANDTDDVFALFEERKAAEEADSLDALPLLVQQPSAAVRRDDEELARNHHRQLDTYLRLLYEFNHVTFVKLPMDDTLQLLSRCGKEAVAHVMEYETQVRLKRQARLRELEELQAEKTALARRRRAAEDVAEARQLAEAEQRQAALDLIGDDTVVVAHGETAGPSRGEVEDEGEREGHAGGAFSPAAHQVHFALPDSVKEEEEVKDTDFVEATVAVGADLQLPLLGEGGDEDV